MSTMNWMLVSILLGFAHAQPGGSSGSSTSDDSCNTDVGDDATYVETIEAASDAYNGYIRRIVSTGCPNHPTASVGDATSNPTDQDKDYSIHAYPCFADMDPYDVTCMEDDIGIAVNGVSITGMHPGGPVCGGDAIVSEADTFDLCAGHANPVGAYHYHILPTCLLDQMGDYDNTDEHSPLIGWAFDGFPIYGPRGPGGVQLYPCTHSSADSSACLDECGGTEQYEKDGFLYHYHLPGPLGDLQTEPISPYPDTSYDPYTIGCFMGVVYDWSIVTGDDNGASCDRAGYNASYTATVTEGVTDIYDAYAVDDGDDPSVEPTTLQPATVSPSVSATETPTVGSRRDGAYEDEASTEGNTDTLIIVAIVCVVLLIAIIVGVVLVMRKRKAAVDEANITADTEDAGAETLTGDNLRLPTDMSLNEA